jgi:hypothetical protein
MIQRFPFASDTNATDFGDLVSGRYGGSGSSSTTDGYSAGGQIIGQFAYGGIEKFSFTTGGLARIVGNLTEERRFTAGHSSPSHGYTSAGIKSPTPSDFVNTIDKYPFSVDTNATNVGDLSEAKSTSGGASSLTNGYVTGGTVPPPTIASNVIDKFPFSSDTNSTDIGDLVDGARRNIANQSDPSGGYGYATGGLPSGPSAGLFDNFIERFSFVSNGNSVDVGDLSQARRWGGGISSSTHGYYAGGGEPPGFVFLSSVEKFPFSSSTSGTNVLNLAIATYGQFTHEG